jgi:hypothetical protein
MTHKKITGLNIIRDLGDGVFFRIKSIETWQEKNYFSQLKKPTPDLVEGGGK